jgi:hypothetical protein
MALDTGAGKKGQQKFGAGIKLDYLQRKMKAYAVTENEMSMLDYYSSQKTAFYSAATFFLGLAFDVRFHSAFSHETPTPEAHLLATWGLGIFIVAAIACAFAGYRAGLRGEKSWNVIREESEEPSSS